LDAARDRLDEKRINARSDFTFDQKQKEIQRQKDQRALKKSTIAAASKAVQASGDPKAAIDTVMNSKLDDPTAALSDLLPVFQQKAEPSAMEKLQIEGALAVRQEKRTLVDMDQKGFIASQEKELKDLLGFTPEYVEQLQNNAKNGKDLFANFDADTSDLEKEDFQENVKYLQSDKFKFAPRDAKVITAMAYEMLKGSDNEWGWDLDGDVKDAFRKVVIDTAANYRKYQKGTSALNSLKASFAKDAVKWNTSQKAYASSLLGSTIKSNLKNQNVSANSLLQAAGIDLSASEAPGIDADPRIAQYMKKWNGIMSPEKGSGNQEETSTDTSTADAEKKLKALAAQESAGFGVATGRLKKAAPFIKAGFKASPLELFRSTMAEHYRNVK